MWSVGEQTVFLRIYRSRDCVKEKGVYLNIEVEEEAWSVYQVLIKGNLLTFNSISNDDKTILRRIMMKILKRELFHPL